MPDREIRAGSQAVTLHGVLRGGRHVLVVPAAGLATVMEDAGLRRYLKDFDVVTGDAGKTPRFQNDGTPPVVLVRPDGHVAARGRPDSTHAVTGYLREFLGEPVGHRRPAVSGTGFSPPEFQPQRTV